MVKASAQITLYHVIDVKASYRYYLLQSSTLAKPSKPTTYPPASTWSKTEPSYSSGSTNSLYFVDCTVFCNNTFEYTDVSLSSSYEAAKEAYNKAVAVNNRVASAETLIEQNRTAINLRATKTELNAIVEGNLIVNGYGLNKDNYNFSQWAFDGTNKCDGFPSFKFTGTPRDLLVPQYMIPVDIRKKYEFRMTFKGDSSKKLYLGWDEFDIDGKQISAMHSMAMSQSYTTLAQDLKDGDTVVYLTSASGWVSTTATHQLGLIFWNYTDSTGYLYPPGVYSRNAWSNLYTFANVNKTNNTITLSSAWNHGTFPAGTKVSQSNSGGHKYFNYSNAYYPADWTETSYVIAGTQDLYKQQTVKFNQACKYMRFVILHNYGGGSTSSTTQISKISLRDVTLEKNLSDNYYTKTQTEAKIKVESDKITAAVSRISANETAISTLEQTADGLTLELERMEVGGTNLLRGTGNIQPLTNPATWANGRWRSGGTTTTGTTKTVETVTGVPNGSITKGFKINVTTAGDNNVAQDAVPVLIGKEYTLSCYAKGTGTLRLQVGKSPYSSTTYDLSSVSSWTKYSHTFVAGDGNGASGNNTNVYLSNRGVGELWICGMKLEVGNRATDWTPSPTDVLEDVTNASKTATNYMNFSSAGLVVGDMTSSTLGRNVLIDSDSVDIRNNTTVLASFGETLIELGKNSSESVISFCGGNATMTATKEAGSGYYDGIKLEGTNVRIYGENLYLHSTMRNNDSNYNRILSTTRTSDNTISNDIDTLMKYSGKQYNSYLSTYSSADSTSQETWADMHSDHYTGSAWKRNWLKVTPTQTTLSDMSNSGVIRPWNKILWSGAYYMNDTQTATLSESVSSQPNGIVLIWSYYVDSAADNSNFRPFFIPKQFVTSHNGKGIAMFLTNSGLTVAASKYVYVFDTKITGHSNNGSAAAAKASGVTSTPRQFVLRYVIGV